MGARLRASTLGMLLAATAVVGAGAIHSAARAFAQRRGNGLMTSNVDTSPACRSTSNCKSPFQALGGSTRHP